MKYAAILSLLLTVSGQAAGNDIPQVSQYPPSSDNSRPLQNDFSLEAIEDVENIQTAEAAFICGARSARWRHIVVSGIWLSIIQKKAEASDTEDREYMERVSNWIIARTRHIDFDIKNCSEQLSARWRPLEEDDTLVRNALLH